MSIKLNSTEIKEMKEWFHENNYHIGNLAKLVTYLQENNYIKTKEDIVIDNMEIMGAENIPLDWLDYDTIVEQDDDYYPLSRSRFLNIFLIDEDKKELMENAELYENSY